MPGVPRRTIIDPMTCCSHCRDAEGFFNARTARRELRRYRRRGPSRPTKQLLDALREEGVEGATLLDVGGGIGAIQHELFARGLQSAIHVDASTSYLEQSRSEAERRGHASRVTYAEGDFVEKASELPAADLVTLDRVICCYPYLEALLAASIGSTRRVLGLVYPRKRLGMGFAVGVTNLWFWLRRSAFRIYLHPPARVKGLVQAAGFRPVRTTRTFLWRVETYRRAASDPDDAEKGTTAFELAR